MQTPRTEFAQAIRALASERKLDADVILSAIQEAIAAAYKRDARERGEDAEEWELEVELDPKTGEAKVFRLEDDKRTDVTPPGFGRIAAQTAKQVIHQKIREEEKSAIMGEYTDRVDSLVSGMILRFDGPNVRVDMGRTEGLMTAEERVPNERLEPNQRLTFLLKEIAETPRGKQLMLSRADVDFIKKLFAREVPEIYSGSVEIKAAAREPGVRTKIAVYSNQPGVDPVGSCVGQKGVRVQAVTNETNERIDIVQWSEDIEEFIKSALSPAEGLSVVLNKDDNTAVVKAPVDQLSLAIGKDGTNAKLASQLTKWRIEIEEDPDAEPINPEFMQEKAAGEESKKAEGSTAEKESKTSKEEAAPAKKKTKKAKKKKVVKTKKATKKEDDNDKDNDK